MLCIAQQLDQKLDFADMFGDLNSSQEAELSDGRTDSTSDKELKCQKCEKYKGIASV